MHKEYHPRTTSFAVDNMLLIFQPPNPSRRFDHFYRITSNLIYSEAFENNYGKANKFNCFHFHEFSRDRIQLREIHWNDYQTAVKIINLNDKISVDFNLLLISSSQIRFESKNTDVASYLMQFSLKRKHWIWLTWINRKLSWILRVWFFITIMHLKIVHSNLRL